MGDASNLVMNWRSALMFAVCLPMVMAAIMLCLRRVERTANIYLALFLLAVVISQIPQIIGFANFYGVWPGLTFAPFNTELYIGPLLYLHAYTLMRKEPLGWRKYLLVPGLLQTAYYSWAFLALGDYKAKWAYSGAVHQPYIWPAETALALGLAIFSLVMIVRLMRRYTAWLENTQSAARDFDPAWLRHLLIAVCVAGALYAFVEIGSIVSDKMTYRAAFPILAVMACVTAYLAFEALSRTAIPFPKMPMEPGDPASAAQPEKDWTAEGAALRQAVTQGEWYLQPRLSIDDLARRMNTNETYISRALNAGLGESFNAFINGLRVAHAKRLLEDTQQSVLEIALASGFNSKATFNRVFRELAGATPTQYRKTRKTSQNP